MHVVRLACFLALAVQCVALSSNCVAALVTATTSVEGQFLRLDSIEVSGPPDGNFPNRQFDYEELIPSIIVDYSSIPEQTSANTITVLGSPASTAPDATERLRLLGDPFLNTGIFNPSATSPAMIVQFDQPIVNGPGGDLLLFELTIGDGQTPDPVRVQQVNNTGDLYRIRPSHYQLSGAIPSTIAPNTFLATVFEGATASFTDLRDGFLLNFGTVTNPAWHGIHFDLSWLGVAPNDSVSSLEIRSGDATRAADLLMVVGQPYTPLSGDYNGDGLVDSFDYSIWRSTFGQSVNPGAAADGNADGTVDLADYTVWRDNLGASLALPRSLVAVPEPGSVALLLLACVTTPWMVSRGARSLPD